MEPILSVEHLSVTFTRYGRGLNRVELNPPEADEYTGDAPDGAAPPDNLNADML